jgi:hypothetical protein
MYFNIIVEYIILLYIYMVVHKTSKIRKHRTLNKKRSDYNKKHGSIKKKGGAIDPSERGIVDINVKNMLKEFKKVYNSYQNSEITKQLYTATYKNLLDTLCDNISIARFSVKQKGIEEKKIIEILTKPNSAVNNETTRKTQYIDNLMANYNQSVTHVVSGASSSAGEPSGASSSAGASFSPAMLLNKYKKYVPPPDAATSVLHHSGILELLRFVQERNYTKEQFEILSSHHIDKSILKLDVLQKFVIGLGPMNIGCLSRVIHETFNSSVQMACRAPFVPKNAIIIARAIDEANTQLAAIYHRQVSPDVSLAQILRGVAAKRCSDASNAAASQQTGMQAKRIIRELDRDEDARVPSGVCSINCAAPGDLAALAFSEYLEGNLGITDVTLQAQIKIVNGAAAAASVLKNTAECAMATASSITDDMTEVNRLTQRKQQQSALVQFNRNTPNWVNKNVAVAIGGFNRAHTYPYAAERDDKVYYLELELAGLKLVNEDQVDEANLSRRIKLTFALHVLGSLRIQNVESAINSMDGCTAPIAASEGHCWGGIGGPKRMLYSELCESTEEYAKFYMGRLWESFLGNMKKTNSQKEKTLLEACVEKNNGFKDVVIQACCDIIMPKRLFDKSLMPVMPSKRPIKGGGIIENNKKINHYISCIFIYFVYYGITYNDIELLLNIFNKTHIKKYYGGSSKRKRGNVNVLTSKRPNVEEPIELNIRGPNPRTEQNFMSARQVVQGLSATAIFNGIPGVSYNNSGLTIITPEQVSHFLVSQYTMSDYGTNIRDINTLETITNWIATFFDSDRGIGSPNATRLVSLNFQHAVGNTGLNFPMDPFTVSLMEIEFIRQKVYWLICNYLYEIFSLMVIHGISNMFGFGNNEEEKKRIIKSGIRLFCVHPHINFIPIEIRRALSVYEHFEIQAKLTANVIEDIRRSIKFMFAHINDGHLNVILRQLSEDERRILGNSNIEQLFTDLRKIRRAINIPTVEGAFTLQYLVTEDYSVSTGAQSSSRTSRHHVSNVSITRPKEKPVNIDKLMYQFNQPPTPSSGQTFDKFIQHQNRLRTPPPMAPPMTRAVTF